ncbi:MAG: hypothetical protein NZ902_06660, partial [Acidilobaceae archaeon]|nr:hypothetical protein [Acidilobaceae archaeon]
RIMTPEYLNEFQRRVGLIALERLREMGDARVDPQALSVIVKNALIRELGEEGFTMIGAPEKMVRAAELVAERGYEPLNTYTFRKVVEMSNIVGRILGRNPKELIDEALSVANRAYERIIEGAAELGPIEKSAMEMVERIFPAAAERVGIAGEFYRGFKSLPRSVQEEVVESLMALEYLKKAIPDPLDGLADAITTLEYWSASNALREMVSVTRFMRVDPEGYLEFIAGRPYWRVERTLPRISAGEFFAESVVEQLPTPTVPVPRQITAIDIPRSKAERGKILGHAVAISRRPRELAMGEQERDISSIARSMAAALYRYVPKATRGILREELPTTSVREITEALAHMKLDRRTKLRVLEKVVSGLERRGRKDLAEELKREGLAAIQRGGQ